MRLGVVIFEVIMEGLMDNILKKYLNVDGTIHVDGWRQAFQAEERVNVKFRGKIISVSLSHSKDTDVARVEPVRGGRKRIFDKCAWPNFSGKFRFDSEYEDFILALGQFRPEMGVT